MFCGDVDRGCDGRGEKGAGGFRGAHQARRACSSTTRLLVLAAKRPDLFQKGSGVPMISEDDLSLLRETVRKSSVDQIYDRIYNSRPAPEKKSRVTEDHSP